MRCTATLLNLPPHARSIVVGNPAIVRVTPLTDAPAVLTGTAFGETNVLVLDEAGHVLLEQPSVVDTKKTVKQIATEAGIEVTKFVRFEVGQE